MLKALKHGSTKAPKHRSTEGPEHQSDVDIIFSQGYNQCNPLQYIAIVGLSWV
jgi:hypothetical protein